MVLITAAAYVRLFMGVDFLDESGYVSIPYTFNLGARPFFDELATGQNVGILLIPFVKAYTFFQPQADGLVLGFRHLYFLLALYTAGRIFLFCRKFIRSEPGVLVALIPLAFIPFSIPNLSYNSVGSLCLLLGMVHSLQLLLVRSRPALDSALSAFFWGLASYAYPTLITVTGPAALYTLARLHVRYPKKARKSPFLSFLAVGLAWLVFVLACIQYSGVENIQRTISYYRIFGTNFGGWEKLRWILINVAENGVYFIAFFAAGIGIWLSGFQNRALQLLMWILLCVLIYFGFGAPNTIVPPMSAIGCFGLLPLGFLFKCEVSKQAELKVFWLLSMFSGLVCAWTSSNGFVNASLGMVSAAVLNLFFVAAFVEESSNTVNRKFGFAAFTAVFVSFLMWTCFRYVYPSDQINRMTVTVRSGAFGGLRTTPERSTFIEDLSRDLESRRPQAQSVIFFNDFPGGYLLSNLARRAHSVWTPAAGILPQFFAERAKIILGFYNDPSKLPDLAVFIVPGLPPLGSAVDPVFEYFSHSPYSLVIDRPGYKIFQK